MSARNMKRGSPPAEPTQGRTDWERLRRMREEEIETNAASDADNPPWTDEDLKNARLVQPGSGRKAVIWVHVDEDVREWVHERAGDTDLMINDLLRKEMERQRGPTAVVIAHGLVLMRLRRRDLPPLSRSCGPMGRAAIVAMQHGTVDGWSPC